MASLDRNDTVTIPMLVAGRGLLTHSMLTNSLGVTTALLLPLISQLLHIHSNYNCVKGFRSCPISGSEFSPP